MLCPNCNQPVDAASTYCSHCGCALPKEEPPTQTAPNGLPATNTMDINAEFRKAEQKEHGFADMFYKAEGRLNRKPYILRVLVLQVGRLLSAADGYCFRRGSSRRLWMASFLLLDRWYPVDSAAYTATS